MSLGQIATAIRHSFLRWREARLRQAALRAWEHHGLELEKVSALQQQYALLNGSDIPLEQRDCFERRRLAAFCKDEAAFMAWNRFYEKHEEMRPADFAFTDAYMEQLQREAGLVSQS